MSATAPREYTPQFIGRSFVKQYYDILSKNPSDLFKFYLAEAQFVHAEDGLEASPIQGTVHIREKIETLKFQGSQINLLQGAIDTMKYDGNHVLVVVTGLFSRKNEAPKQFSHTFVLVGQNNNFFVSSSVCRLLKDGSTAAVATTSVEATPVTAPPAPFAETHPPTPPVEVVPSPNAVEVIVEEVKVEQEVSAKEETKVDEPKKEENVKEKKEKKEEVKEKKERREKREKKEEAKVKESIESKIKVVEETPKGPLSYLDIARKHAASNANNDQAVAEDKGFKVLRSVLKPESEDASAGQQDQSKKEKKMDKRVEYPVYVAGVQKEIRQDSIETAFCQFGDVQKIDFTNDKDFCFVKFQNPEGMEAALAAGSVLVDGHTLRIEKRTTKKDKFVPTKDGEGQKDKKIERSAELDAQKKDKNSFKKSKENNKTKTSSA